MAIRWALLVILKKFYIPFKKFGIVYVDYYIYNYNANKNEY